MNHPSRTTRKRQAGLTLVELMVAIVVGMLLVAGIATLIANQSTNRADVDRSGKLIENGRFALSTMAADVQMAGYWGELEAKSLPAVPAIPPSPCDVTLPVLESGMGISVQGYDSAGTLPAELNCVGNTFKPGTDILVVRKADPATATTNLADDAHNKGYVYVQTGLNATSSLKYKIATYDSSTNASFDLTQKADASGVKPTATLRRYVLHIYYISQCSVEVSSNNCAGADDGNPIPTLKMVELGANGTFNKVTIAEGIQNMQIRYGRDTDNDGMPNGEDLLASEIPAANWADIMSVKVYLLARSTETTPDYVDKKQYVLGKANVPADVDGPANDHYKRHVFAQSIRLVNPGLRRMN